MLVLFLWQQRYVYRIVATESGIELLTNPSRFIGWSEVYFVTKSTSLLSGFYKVKLDDGELFYFPIKSVPPTFPNLLSYGTSLTEMDKLFARKGIIVH